MGFCPRCGSKLCGVFKEQIVCVSLGSLDDTADVRIDEHIFVGSKARWDIIGGDAPQFEERNPAAKPKLA